MPWPKGRPQPMSLERRAHISAALKGRVSPAKPCPVGCTCGKHSLRNAGQFSGENRGFLGRLHSDETKAKLRAARLRQPRDLGGGGVSVDASLRFPMMVMPLSETGCHIWTGALDTKGYGAFGFGRRVVRAHRYAYEQRHGLIPAGLEIDHLCRVRCCVNPDHLEAVTHAENVRRARTGGQ